MSISHILYHAQFLVKIIFHMCFKYKNVNDSINIEKKSILYIYIYIYISNHLVGAAVVKT
jgi:hypothetical protein